MHQNSLIMHALAIMWNMAVNETAGALAFEKTDRKKNTWKGL